MTKKMKLQRVSAKLNDTPFLRAPLSGKTSKIQPPPIYEGVGFNLREQSFLMLGARAEGIFEELKKF